MSLISLYKLLTRTYLLYFKFYCSGKLSNDSSNTMGTVALKLFVFPSNTKNTYIKFTDLSYAVAFDPASRAG